MTRVLPEDGAVCTEMCERDLINNNTYSTACVHLVDILKDIIVTLFCYMWQESHINDKITSPQVCTQDILH